MGKEKETLGLSYEGGAAVNFMGVLIGKGRGEHSREKETCSA